ncbi:MAG: hypothetical protein AMXMBFR13_21870 [Phycisphaerae bacterium]
MRASLAISCCALALVVVGTAVWVQAGPLTPPAGPVAPTMKTLNELSDQIAAVQAALPPAGVKRVIRGVITLNTGETEKSQNFSPSVDPAKSVVLLSEAVIVVVQGAPSSLVARNGAAVLSLGASSVTVATDPQQSQQRLSYQIVEYN